MSLTLGQKLRIRSMVYVAAEPIPFFWPMRSFIHHNPLHGLEDLPFEQAVEQGRKLFHGDVFLPRTTYQRYLVEDRIDRDHLAASVAAFAAGQPPVEGIDLPRWLMTVLTETNHQVVLTDSLAAAADVTAALHGNAPQNDTPPPVQDLTARLRAELLGDRPVYEAVDALYGTEVGDSLDELVIKSCLDFFDEGQSVWSMPGRERGFFTAWRSVARRNIRFFLRGLHIRRILEAADSPEGVIAHVMGELGIPESQWAGYFTRELSRLHGWAGFIRWRSTAKHYHWARRYPADLVDFLAVRLTLALALLHERGRRHMAWTASAISELIDTHPRQAYLRYELYSGQVLPALAHDVERVLARGRQRDIERMYATYVAHKRVRQAMRQSQCLLGLANRAGGSDQLRQLAPEALGRLLETLKAFEQQEGMVWLKALESRALSRLLSGLSLAPSIVRDKRPFGQALFCIDTRSERIRRHLEGVGDYQTYGIAGFFGVPVSFMELGKGSETHLCPVILTPKNVVIEMTTADQQQDAAAVTALEKALHELKESVLTPFVTVEAIGLLFGFDMIGKTLAPQRYNRWRQRLHPHKPSTRLLLDKLTREQADSIVRAVQRAVIGKAVEQDFELSPEDVTDTMIRELREAALGKASTAPAFATALKLDEPAARAFIERLRNVYRINYSYAHMQMERLGRIGFGIDEQVNYVSQALQAIGLTRDFSRFVLLVGHGSTSENNPYESALDCGACGGNHGLVSARVLAQMANKAEVRRRLREQGIDIADDAWFIPALHNTTTDELKLHDLDLLPPTHLIYLDRLRSGLVAASRLCAQERLPTLENRPAERDPAEAYRAAQRNALDWTQVRPEWGLSRNAYFVIGRRDLTASMPLEGRAFLHSYDYRIDPKRRLLENILTGPLVVGQWINMEHYFSAVDNERFGSGSKVYHNVAGRFGVMTGNLSDLRTGLPSQTVLKNGEPYHEPLRLITVIEAPFEHARRAVECVVAVKNLVHNGWIRLVIADPETGVIATYDDGEWLRQEHTSTSAHPIPEESSAS